LNPSPKIGWNPYRTALADHPLAHGLSLPFAIIRPCSHGLHALPPNGPVEGADQYTDATMAGPSLEGLINPDLLVWARAQSRMDLETAAAKIHQTPERLAEWEAGTRFPTLNQLRDLANVYKRSVGVFFLRVRPRVPRRPVDYRQLEVKARETMTPALSNGVREAEAKRDAALDIYAQLEELPPEWTIQISRNASAEDAATTLLERLGVTMQTRAGWKNHYEALAGWRAAAESLGVIVVQLRNVPMEEMRGCAIALFPLPVIILNSADSPLGRVFTLLHELTHLARAESSLCDLIEDAPRADADAAVEAYCNRVAGLVLVPSAELQRLPEVQRANGNTPWSNDALLAMRRAFWASREVILRRLMDSGKTSREFYRAQREQFLQEYAAQREQGGPVPYHRIVLLTNGRFLTRLALSAYGAQAITAAELSRILNAKLDHLPRIREALKDEVIA
jgi:Zn-dependent peptidase ImmA (M78 family)/transcriptional regulator with XRE-family HTH domain